MFSSIIRKFRKFSVQWVETGITVAGTLLLSGLLNGCSPVLLSTGMNQPASDSPSNTPEGDGNSESSKISASNSPAPETPTDLDSDETDLPPEAPTGPNTASVAPTPSESSPVATSPSPSSSELSSATPSTSDSSTASDGPVDNSSAVEPSVPSVDTASTGISVSTTTLVSEDCASGEFVDALYMKKNGSGMTDFGFHCISRTPKNRLSIQSYHFLNAGNMALPAIGTTKIVTGYSKGISGIDIKMLFGSQLTCEIPALAATGGAFVSLVRPVDACSNNVSPGTSQTLTFNCASSGVSEDEISGFSAEMSSGGYLLNLTPRHRSTTIVGGKGTACPSK